MGKMVNTIHGPMNTDLLEKKEGSVDNKDEYTTWVEYWLKGELVHRSVHVTLKKMPKPFGSQAGGF